MNRRTFVKGISATAAATLVLHADLLAFPAKKIIGIQLYTLRDLIAADFQGTLKKISKAGYNSVEAAGYGDRKFYGYAPKEYKKIVTGLGLLPTSSHTNVSIENIGHAIEDHLEAGMNYLVIPYLAEEKRKTIDDYKNLASEFNALGKICKDAGLGFGYHNHAFEFEKMGNEIPYDILIENTDPRYVFMEVDMFWMVYGGHQPEEYFTKYPGRFELWHIKDMDNTPNRESTEIGDGIINYAKVFKMKDLAGMKNFFVEQEAFKIDPIKSITKSCRFLKSLSY
jgi:sugar phosphate isomerase/epimerase